MMCQYCGRKPKGDELTIDHVVPRAQGGTSTWENCVLACIRCNHSKADRTPAKAGLKLLNMPKHPNWNPVYSQHSARFKSWAKFVSDAYWDAELED
jgi:5-methylcytosine-specific restriction endonuclease McrA